MRETQEDLEGGERQTGRNDVTALLCKIFKKKFKKLDVKSILKNK